jgi:molecular chaperone Hsp33
MLTAGAMIGIMMKGEDDLLTIKAQGDGPIGFVTVTADSKGGVKGYVGNPEVMLPPNAKGKLDVGGSLGVGVLTVIKDIGLKEPYVGQTILVSDEMITKLEEKLSTITSITSLLDEGKTPEMILEYLLGEFGLEINDKIPTAFSCNCSREKIEKALIGVGREELQSMIDDGETIELNCQFCNKHYPVTVDELKELLEKATR